MLIRIAVMFLGVFWKKISKLIVLLIFLSTSINGAVSAGLGSLGKVISRHLAGNVITVPQGEKPAFDLLNHFPGMKKFIRKVSRHTPQSEREEVSGKLENLMIYTLSDMGYSSDIILAAGFKPPKYLVDNIQSRAIDLLVEYNDLLSKALIESEQVRLFDSTGKAINSVSEHSRAFRLVIKKYYPTIDAKNSSTFDDYLKTVKSGLAKSKYDFNLDAETNKLSITISNGSLKGKIVNIDLSKHYDSLKKYLIGGGIAGVTGYAASKDSPNNTNSVTNEVRKTKDQMKYYRVIRKLSNFEREDLFNEVEYRYLIREYNSRYGSNLQ